MLTMSELYIYKRNAHNDWHIDKRNADIEWTVHL